MKILLYSFIVFLLVGCSINKSSTAPINKIDTIYYQIIDTINAIDTQYIISSNDVIKKDTIVIVKTKTIIKTITKEVYIDLYRKKYIKDSARNQKLIDKYIKDINRIKHKLTSVQKTNLKLILILILLSGLLLIRFKWFKLP